MNLRKLFSIRIAILCLWALALIAIIIITGPDQVIGSYRNLTPQGIKQAIDSFGLFSVLAFILASIARPLLFIPVSPFTIASGFMFGMWWGLLWSLTGTTLSAIFIFYLSRYILHDYVMKHLMGKYPAVDKMLESRGWNFVLFLRMIPVLPFDLVSCFAGVSRIPFRDYLIGTVIGEIPGAVVLVMLGSSLDDIGSGFFFLSLGLAIAVFTGTELVRRWIFKRKKVLSQ